MRAPVRAMAVIVAAAAVASSAGCGGRWVSSTPRTIRVVGHEPSPTQVFEHLLARARALGYQIDQIDPSRVFFRVQAFTAPGRPSYFNVQVHADLSVVVSPGGFYVRRGGRLIHRNIQAELDRFVRELAAAVAAMAPGLRAP